MHVYTDSDIIDTTTTHPFYVEGRGFVAAADLQEGDKIYALDGSLVEVKAVEIEKLAEEILVYNLEVEENHTYFVGEEVVLVHNSCEMDNDNGGDVSCSKSELTSDSKRQDPNQSALHKLAKEAEKNAKNGNPISYEEAEILDGWAKDYNVPQHHPAEIGSGQHFPGGNYMDHTHIYNIHVPYEYR